MPIYDRTNMYDEREGAIIDAIRNSQTTQPVDNTEPVDNTVPVDNTSGLPPWVTSGNPSDWLQAQDGSWIHKSTGNVYGADGTLVYEEPTPEPAGEWTDGMTFDPATGMWQDSNGQWYTPDGQKYGGQNESPIDYPEPRDPETGGVAPQPDDPFGDGDRTYPDTSNDQIGWNPDYPIFEASGPGGSGQYIPMGPKPETGVAPPTVTMPEFTPAQTPPASPTGGPAPGYAAPPTGGISGPQRDFNPHGEVIGQFSAPRSYGGLPRSTGPWGVPGAWYEGQSALASALRGK